MTSKSILLLEKIGTQGYVLCDDILMEKTTRVYIDYLEE